MASIRRAAARSGGGGGREEKEARDSVVAIVAKDKRLRFLPKKKNRLKRKLE
jgi:hypothetical protein